MKSDKSTILIINQFFFPDQTALSQMITELASAMTQKDYAVSVLCSEHVQLGIENSHSEIRDINIIKVPGTKFGKTSTLGRLLDFLSFYLMSFFRLLFLPRHDIVFVTTAPPMIGLLGVVAKRFFKSIFVYNVQDLYPHTAVQAGVIRHPLVISIFEKLLSVILNQADMVVAIGEDMKEKILSISPGARVTVIQNWADGKMIYPVQRSENIFLERHKLNGCFVVMYSGNFGLVHEFATILNAAELLKDTAEIRLLFVGGGKNISMIESQVIEKKLSNVTILPYQPKEMLPYSLSAAEISLISLANGMEGLIVPSKLYSAMASGRAVLFLGSEKSVVSQIVKMSDSGVTIPIGDAKKMAEEILSLYHDKNRLHRYQLNSRKYFENNLDYPISMGHYDLLFRRLLQ